LQGEVQQAYTREMVRALLGFAAFLALAAPVPQSSFDLHARYGEPDVQRFAIRPDITMTVEYGDDHNACILDIRPRQAFIQGFPGSQDSFSKDTAVELLNEVVAPADRGNQPLGFPDGITAISSCAGITVGGTRSVQTEVGLDFCKKPVGVRSLEVQFNRPACDSLTKKK